MEQVMAAPSSLTQPNALSKIYDGITYWNSYIEWLKNSE